MQVSLHAIGNTEFSVNIHQAAGVPVLTITAGGAVVDIFLHDGKAERALDDIDTAIRAFYHEERE